MCLDDRAADGQTHPNTLHLRRIERGDRGEIREGAGSRGV